MRHRQPTTKPNVLVTAIVVSLCTLAVALGIVLALNTAGESDSLWKPDTGVKPMEAYTAQQHALFSELVSAHHVGLSPDRQRAIIRAVDRMCASTYGEYSVLDAGHDLPWLAQDALWSLPRWTLDTDGSACSADAR